MAIMHAAVDTMNAPSKLSRKFPIRGLADIPRVHAKTQPEHPALIFGDRVCTYR